MKANTAVLPVINDTHLALDIFVSQSMFFIKTKSIARIYYLDASVYAYLTSSGKVIFKTKGSVVGRNDFLGAVENLAVKIAKKM